MARVKCKCIQNMMHVGQIVQAGEFIEVDERDVPSLVEREFIVTVKDEIKKLEAVLNEELPVLKGNPTPTKENLKVEPEEEIEETAASDFFEEEPKKKPARKSRKKKGK